MTKDPMVEEIRRIREQPSNESGNDLTRIAEAARLRQASSTVPRQVDNLPSKAVSPNRKAS